MKFVGRGLKRSEDPRLLTGQGLFVDDLRLPRMAFAGFLRSPYAHAKLREIDVSQAKNAPGVVGVNTWNDLEGKCKPIPPGGTVAEGKAVPRPLLASAEVRFVGDPIAMVVGVDRHAVADAVELVAVDYDLLPVVVDPEQALRKDSPRVYEEFPDNLAYYYKREAGDVEEAFRQADVVVEERLVNQRLAPVPLETRGVVADYDPQARVLTVWTSTQIPITVRSQLSRLLEFPKERIRVLAQDVGGGFGAKLNVYMEEILTAYAALQLKRPVKWIETRRENLQATTHGRGQIHDVAVAARRDGTILGLKDRIIADVGAYNQWGGAFVPTLTVRMLPGCYRIRNLRAELYCVFTNKTPTDAYRGAGRPEATYVIERVMDLVARRLGLDPAAVRRRNFVGRSEFPYKTVTRYEYDSGDYGATLKKALQAVDYAGWRQRQAELWKEGRLLGVGLSTYVEICGMGPGLGETATVRVMADGIEVLTGTLPHGQGHASPFAQICADELGISVDQVRVRYGDSLVVPFGEGTFGSRSAAVGGSAILLAARELKKQAVRRVSEMWKVSRDRLRCAEGYVVEKGASSRRISLFDLAQRISGGAGGRLEATHTFDPANYTFPFGAHVAVVEVDRETGSVHVLKYVAVDDCGRVINPLIVEGQVHGGVVQGLGQALYEEVVYDKNGQLQTATLMDYLIPTSLDVTPVETWRTVTPSPSNPLGLKGVGEAGTIAATPAVLNAVQDALAPYEVTVRNLPAKPEELWRALKPGFVR